MYTGYKELILSDEQMANFYTNSERLTQDLIENEYLLIEDLNGMPVDKYCYQTIWESKIISETEQKICGCL